MLVEPYGHVLHAQNPAASDWPCATSDTAVGLCDTHGVVSTKRKSRFTIFLDGVASAFDLFPEPTIREVEIRSMTVNEAFRKDRQAIRGDYRKALKTIHPMIKAAQDPNERRRRA